MLHNLIVLSTGLLVISSFVFGIFSILRNPKSQVVKMWFLTSLSIFLWSLVYLLLIIAKDESGLLNYLYILHLATIFIPIFYYHFVLEFLFKKGIIYNLILLFGYSVAVLMTVVLFFGSFYDGLTYTENFGFYANVTTSFSALIIYFVVYVTLSIYLLSLSYVKSDGSRKRQVGFVLLASLIGFGGGLTNFMFNLFGIYPYGQMVVWLYPVIVTYGIFIDEFKFKLKF